MSLPLADLHLTSGAEVAFLVVVRDQAGVELERHPLHRPIDVKVPGADFETQNWNV